MNAHKISNIPVVVGADVLQTFKESWPCNGIPDDVAGLIYWFSGTGDLLDIQCLDASGKETWEGDESGAALAALAQDAWGKAL